MDAIEARRIVLGILNEVDAYGLDPGHPDGTPGDEYDLEAGPIAEVLETAGSIDSLTLDSIWTSWFGEPLTQVIGRSAVAELVGRFNAVRAGSAPPSA